MRDLQRVRLVGAEMRIDRTAFSRLWRQAVDAGRYGCPHCRAVHEFLATDFERGFGACRGVLDPAWRLGFAAKRPLREDDREACIDFACRGCGAPARIIYRAGRASAMGCLDWEILAVVEAESWPPAAVPTP